MPSDTAVRPCDSSGSLVMEGQAGLERQDNIAALSAFERALAQRPGDERAWLGRGMALSRLGRGDEAFASARCAVALTPSLAAAQYNLGVMLARDDQRREAAEAYRRACVLAPDHAPAHHNRALALLKLGRYDEGWAELEWRFRLGVALPEHGLPVWDGGSLAGRRLLLHMEAGFGDSIQMIRFVPRLAAMGAAVGVECKEPLVRLFGAVPGVRTVHAMGAVDPQSYDLMCGSYSVPHRLGTALDTLPRQCPYIDAARFGASSAHPVPVAVPAALSVGLAWAGDPMPAGGAMIGMDRDRSLPFAALAQLLDRRGVRFHSLQKGEAAAEAEAAVRGGRLHDSLAGAADFADTAAVIRKLDLVISVDTAVAHLAGALGKPVWLLSRYDGCWRWIERREDTPWYPSMRLFHQPSPGDWEPVLARVGQELDRMAQDWTAGGAAGKEAGR